MAFFVFGKQDPNNADISSMERQLHSNHWRCDSKGDSVLAQRLRYIRKMMTVKIFTLLLCFQISFAHACLNSDKRWFLVGNSVSDITTSTLERELERFLSTKPAGLLLPLDKYIFSIQILARNKSENSWALYRRIRYRRANGRVYSGSRWWELLLFDRL